MSKAKTQEEVTKDFLDQIKAYIHYWQHLPEDRVPDGEDVTRWRLWGVTFSILGILDGSSMGLPAFDLVLRPHPDDKEFFIEQGLDWFEDGMVINEEVILHEELYKK